METKRDLKSLTHQELENIIRELGYPRYRVKQIEEWLYLRNCDIISNMDNLPASLRAALEEHFSLTPLSLVTRQVSQDGTRKYLFKLHDGACVETVGIPSHDERHLTVCFSSQAGCPMGCTFCATGRAGFTRNLHSGEMYDQVKYVSDDFDIRVSNIVCMGQGEPFLNYDSVLTALRRMNSKPGLDVGARHITVSTCGVLEGIRRFTQEPEQFTLAISLHSALQNTRDEIMPAVSHQPLDELHHAIEEYIQITNRRPSFEYAPMAGINDDDEHIEALIRYCRDLLCHVNLIPLNPIDDSNKAEHIMEPSPRLKTIAHRLEEAGITYSIRKSRGKDIDGACGQLRQRLS